MHLLFRQEGSLYSYFLILDIPAAEKIDIRLPVFHIEMDYWSAPVILGNFLHEDSLVGAARVNFADSH